MAKWLVVHKCVVGTDIKQVDAPTARDAAERGVDDVAVRSNDLVYVAPYDQVTNFMARPTLEQFVLRRGNVVFDEGSG